jgi:hypothetical protein
MMALVTLVGYTSATLLEAWTPRLLAAIAGALVEGPVLVQARAAPADEWRQFSTIAHSPAHHRLCRCCHLHGQEACVSAIIALAESVRGAPLAAHYDNVMPILKQLLTHARGAALEALWGRTLECCAVVGESSGKEKFMPDAMEMMRSMEAMQVRRALLNSTPLLASNYC